MLPPEIWEMIIGECDIEETQTLACLNKEINHIVKCYRNGQDGFHYEYGPYDRFICLVKQGVAKSDAIFEKKSYSTYLCFEFNNKHSKYILTFSYDRNEKLEIKINYKCHEKVYDLFLSSEEIKEYYIYEDFTTSRGYIPNGVIEFSKIIIPKVYRKMWMVLNRDEVESILNLKLRGCTNVYCLI